MRQPTLIEKLLMIFGFALAFAGPPTFFFNQKLLVPFVLILSGLLITTAGYLPNRPRCRQTSDYVWEQISGNRPIERKWLLTLVLYIGYFFFFCLLPGALRLNLFCLIGLGINAAYFYLICRVARNGEKEGEKDGQRTPN
ncbi:MAG: hypothetical protein BWY24_00830 [Microgenomates group bacterium ADurb.Bin219]|nr:MAG: hypothetical protein BWY24_00830 [Microgenomates group bacterium ADurb.Bin219]HNP89263.1 hypothetical protein [Candidatus Woesebacteria bacterium]